MSKITKQGFKSTSQFFLGLCSCKERINKEQKREVEGREGGRKEGRKVERREERKRERAGEREEGRKQARKEKNGCKLFLKLRLIRKPRREG